MAMKLPGGLSGLPLADVGLGPGRDSASPRYLSTDIATTPSNINAWIAAADTYDFTLVARLAGNRDAWTTPGPATPSSPGGTLIYDPAQYQANIERYRGNATLADAITRRRIIVETVDEPYLAAFNGTIPKSAQNQQGLWVKDVWADALTAIRASASFLTPPPAGGWTGLDYGMSHYAPRDVKAGVSMASFFASEKAALAAIDMGMMPGFNWLNAGDGRLWDYLNTGSSSGRITGASTGATPNWLSSPAEIRQMADTIWNDPDAPCFTGYLYLYPSSLENDYQIYQDRSDYVAEFDYLLNKFASRPLFNGFRTAKGTVVVPPPGFGEEIEHFASATITTRVSTQSGTYTNVPGVTIPASNLAAGKRYLLVATGAIDLSATNANASVRVVSGSTPLDLSQMSWRPLNIASRWPYCWWTIHTAVAGEDINLQYKSSDGIASVGANFCTLFAMNLSDDLIEGVDYKYALSSAVSSLTTAYRDGASITFTPAVAGQDWLVLTAAHFLTPSTSQSVVSGLRRDGEAVETDPEVQVEGETGADEYLLCTAKVLSLTGSNTLAEQSKNTGGGGPRDGSAVFALRLNRFAAHGFQYDNSTLEYGSSDYQTTVASTSVTAPADGDLWVLGSQGSSLVNFAGAPIRARLQVDGADNPLGQTAARYGYAYSYDVTDVTPILFQAVPTVTAGLHTADVDASFAFPNTGRGAKGRLTLALTMRLTAAAAGATLFRRSPGNLGTRSGTRKVH